jgi:hypothetical protein
LAFKYAMNCATLSAGTDGCTTRTFDNNIVPPTGTLSRTKSNGSFSYKLAFIGSLRYWFNHRMIVGVNVSGEQGEPPRGLAARLS